MRYLISLLLLSCSSAFAFSVDVNGQPQAGRLLFGKQDGKPVVHLAVTLAQISDVKSANFKIETDLYPVQFKKLTGGTLFMLPSFAGELVIEASDGTLTTLPVTMAPTKSYFKVDKSCRIPGLRVGGNSKVETSHFGGIYCQKEKSGKIVRVHLSTAQVSDWLGSDLFEIDGKGTRWKTYDIPLDGTKPKSSFRWGPEESASVAMVLMKPPPVPKDEEPPPYFFLGGELLQQSAKARGQSSSNMSAAIRLDVLFPFSKKIRIRGNGGYLIQTLSGNKAKDPKYFQFRVGADYVFENRFFVTGAYDMLSFSSAKPDLLVDFEAPLVGAGYRVHFEKRALDLQGFYSQPVTGGGGSSRMGFELALKPFYFFDKTKGVLVYEIIKLKDPVPVDSDRISIQWLYGF